MKSACSSIHERRKRGRKSDVTLPGALRIPIAAIEQHIAEIPRDKLIIPLLHVTP